MRWFNNNVKGNDSVLFRMIVRTGDQWTFQKGIESLRIFRSILVPLRVVRLLPDLWSRWWIAIIISTKRLGDMTLRFFPLHGRGNSIGDICNLLMSWFVMKVSHVTEKKYWLDSGGNPNQSSDLWWNKKYSCVFQCLDADLRFRNPQVCFCCKMRDNCI